MFNINTLLKMLGITPEQVQVMQKHAREGASKAEESYERLKRLEKMMETINHKLNYVSEKVNNGSDTAKFVGGAGGDTGIGRNHEPNCRCDYCGQLEWKPNTSKF